MNPKVAVPIGLLLLATACRSNAESYSPRQHESGLTVQELVVPETRVARVGDRVRVHYHGTLANGEVFDSSVERGQPLEFTLGAGEVPPGLDEGVEGMHVYGSRRLTAPIELMFPGGAPPELAGEQRVYLSIELLEILDEDGSPGT